MKLFWLPIFFSLLFLIGGCKPQEVELTITYDKNPENAFPYTSYGDIAKIYYTIGGKNFEYSIPNHQSIKIKVVERTEIRASIEKFITDGSGPHSARDEIIYKVDSSKPVWKL
jgi:hypothetical protein